MTGHENFLYAALKGSYTSWSTCVSSNVKKQVPFNCIKHTPYFNLHINYVAKTHWDLLMPFLSFNYITLSWNFHLLSGIFGGGSKQTLFPFLDLLDLQHMPFESEQSTCFLQMRLVFCPDLSSEEHVQRFSWSVPTLRKENLHVTVYIWHHPIWSLTGVTKKDLLITQAILIYQKTVKKYHKYQQGDTIWSNTNIFIAEIERPSEWKRLIIFNLWMMRDEWLFSASYWKEGTSVIQASDKRIWDLLCHKKTRKHRGTIQTLAWKSRLQFKYL